MNYGLYLSASGALNNLYKQDLYANNLANANTIGFKPDMPMTRMRLPERLEASRSNSPFADPNELLEQLGGGLEGDLTRIRLTQGNLLQTGNELDVAFRGEGFLVVGSDQGDELMLSRDGRLSLDTQSRLVLASSGKPVLNIENQPIVIDSTLPVEINGSGQLIQDNQVVDQLRLSQPVDPTSLRKMGNNLMRLTDTAPEALVAATGELLQNHVEASATDPITTLTDMIDATKDVQGNVKMMQYHDHVMGIAINTMGRMT